MTPMRSHRKNTCRSAIVVALSLVLAAGLIGSARAQTSEAPNDSARAGLEAALAREPDDAALRYRLARQLAQSGASEAALAEYDALLARYPDNADYLLGRAQMLSRLDRVAEGLAATGQALALAPEYEDVWQLHLQLAWRSGNEMLAATVRAEAAARYPAASWWRLPEPPPVYTRWVTLGNGTDRLSNDAPDWKRRTLRLDWQNDPAAYFGEVASAERFGSSDETLTVGVSWQALPEWHVGSAISGTRDADFAPSRELAIEALRPWRGGWGSELRYRRREYETATVSSYAFTGDKYIASFRVAYRLDYSWLNGADSSLGHSLTLNWYPGEKRSFGVTFGAGEEIETIGIDQLLRTSVTSLTLSGRETLSPRLGLNWWLGTHEQGNYYRRNYAGVSVRIGF